MISEWLTKGAQAWANYLYRNNQFTHSKAIIDGKKVGENLYRGAGDVSKSWYNEVKNYKYGNG
jgi:hypothetical protein